jgi:hypothetical protein
MTRRVLVLTLSALLLEAAAARAQTPDATIPTASDASAKGQQAYEAKQYADAAKQFMIAYGLDPNPLYLFNAAQAYRLGDKCTEAIDAYRQFLQVVKDKQLNVSNLDQVTGYIEGMRTCAKNQQAAATAEHTQTNPQPPPAAPSRTTPVLAYSVLGVGAATLLFSAAAGINTVIVHGNAQTAQTSNPTHLAGLNADGHFWASAADVTAWVGGGIVVVGAALWYLHHRGDNEHVMVVPTGPSGAAVLGTWTF